MGSFFDLLREPEWRPRNKNVNTAFCLVDAAAVAAVPFARLQGMPHLNRPELSENFVPIQKKARIGLKITKQKLIRPVPARSHSIGQNSAKFQLFGQNFFLA